MKRLSYILMLLVLACTTSCIEEYNELPDDQAERMVVIDGQIVGESECTFMLRYSAPLDEMSTLAYKVITDAQVAVVGSNGVTYVGHQTFDRPGRYVVKVGKLDPEVSYSLEVNCSEGSFVSRPMLPLDAPDITEFCYEQPREDRLVDFYISTADPQALVYYRWDFQETWEIFTPYKCYWSYAFDNPSAFEQWDPGNKDQAVPTGRFVYIGEEGLKNHGWCKNTSKDLLFASNVDYGQGAIQRRCLYQLNPDNNRFQTRYLTHVRQMAISAEEYEYLHLLATQSSEMGGLFTPMPSELPSNISGLDGSRAIGFIGVRGHIGEAEIYINRKEVDHNDLYTVKIVADSLAEEPPYMLKRGYRIIDYNPYMGTVSWSNRWAVDCTDNFWGASLERPDYWIDEKKD